MIKEAAGKGFIDTWLLPSYDPWYYGREGEVSRMTIAIALSGIDSIVLATDSRETHPVFQANGRVCIGWEDDVPKLFSLNDYVGVMFASTIPGYEQWAVDLFNETVTNRDSKSFREIVESFAQLLNEDFYKYVNREQAKFMLGGALEFVFGGYNPLGKPRIAKIGWTATDQGFVPHPIPSHYHATGVPGISNYLANKFKDHLPNMDTMSLQRLATLLVTETSTTEKTVDDKVQMLVIEKGGKLRFIAPDKIEKLKSEVNTIVDKGELFNRLIG